MSTTTASPKYRTIISFDVGVRNLSYCRVTFRCAEVVSEGKLPGNRDVCDEGHSDDVIDLTGLAAPPAANADKAAREDVTGGATSEADECQAGPEVEVPQPGEVEPRTTPSATLREGLRRLEVVQWDCVDILTTQGCSASRVYSVPTTRLLRFLIQHLEANFHFEEAEGPVAVRVEEQPNGSNKMKAISYGLMTYFTTVSIRRPELHMDVFGASAKDKLTLCTELGIPETRPARVTKGKGVDKASLATPTAAARRRRAKGQQYRTNKWRAVQGCPLVLQHVTMSPTLRVMWAKSRKKDDLADCSLEATSAALAAIAAAVKKQKKGTRSNAKKPKAAERTSPAPAVTKRPRRAVGSTTKAAAGSTTKAAVGSTTKAAVGSTTNVGKRLTTVQSTNFTAAGSTARPQQEKKTPGQIMIED